MRVVFGVGGLTIDWANGARQIVMFGGRGVGIRDAAASNGGMAKALQVAALACPVILWDEAESTPPIDALARSG